jgi:hypothetical protein
MNSKIVLWQSNEIVFIFRAPTARQWRVLFIDERIKQLKAIQTVRRRWSTAARWVLHFALDTLNSLLIKIRKLAILTETSSLKKILRRFHSQSAISEKKQTTFVRIIHISR